MLYRRRLAASSVAAALAAGIIVAAPVVQAQEPAACLSPDPAQWPASSKPYFMIAFDTSGSMDDPVGSDNSCGYTPLRERVSHGRCAIWNTINAYSGQVNLGLATFPMDRVCTTGCYSGCGTTTYPLCNSSCGCGTRDNRQSALIRVPMWKDRPGELSNVASLLNWVDGDCTDGQELYRTGSTPINGMLRDMYRYYTSGLTSAVQCAQPCPSPLESVALGERACRSVNVILVTDGGETCDNTGDAVDAAQMLYCNTESPTATNCPGFVKDGITWHVRTHVIDFATAAGTSDRIADAGDDGVENGSATARYAADEATLSQEFAKIISSSIAPEVCDNVDNNCNGCTDEGYNHYCNRGQTCCSWNTPVQRTTCLTNYQNSITPGNPSGNLALLPCTTPAQQSQPANWLCYDPKEICDNIDNNCVGGVDETVTKCGSPLHCPAAETCNGQDDDCDGITDEGVCSGCTPTAEVCDGCDNDCDGVADNGIAPVACGFSPPANCAGSLTCTPQPVSTPGGCAAGGGWSPCSNNPQTETCDSIDNDCDGIVDDGIASVACVPAGTSAGLVYGGDSQCRQGTQSCGGTCTGFVGPSAEICDGIDNDCNGVVDDNAFGVGQSCGFNQPPCSPGTTACVNAVIVCQGGIQPEPEVCDGIDNNCNGTTDEAPLMDSPAAGSNGCWNDPGNCCTFDALSWCPPAGATCSGTGILTVPCKSGTLACVAGGWACQGPKGPSAEVCDGVDNNCDGTLDNGVPLVGQTCGVDTGECTAGIYECTSGVLSCPGEAGPKAEECNGLDDDCDGQVDEGIGGLGVACGNSTAPCSPGVTACVNGQVICQGGTLPQAEQCDGIDNDCDGVVDDAPLSDAPAAGQTGCWNLPGSCCTFDDFSWCPPAGGTCSAAGTLTPPCGAGVLRCTSGAWGCSGAKGPGTETCDGVDNDCDGAVDDVQAVDCVPPGTPGNLVYGGDSQCRRGQQTCGACAGFVGPTTEICDSIDNDCDGTVDEGAIGTNQDCGIANPPCTLGKTACVNGTLACQGGVQPEPEICDGIDNDCNGTADDGSLLDAPPAAEKGCWQDPGNCCTFANLSWCPPAGATCYDNGALGTPCNKGFLACTGTTGWACLNPRGPSSEVCDGIDNDCNGTADDGNLPGIGDTCGQNIGECKEGALACTNGVLDCVGDVPPTDEECDGLDNNCNGVNDDGVSTGGPCVMEYDQQLYPGNRDQGACQLGVAECDGSGGIQCQGGIGPSTEVCDGIDNDCDGTVDEIGASPDGIDGSANPTGVPAAKIGDACGVSEGLCEAGTWRCRYGMFACLGGVAAELERCDCSDNDCNGEVDNENPPGEPRLCGEGKACVKFGNNCQCAAPCAGGEFPCGGGQQCESVNSSNTGEALGAYCIIVQDLCVGGCADKTVKDANNNVLCAPAGTDAPGCHTIPVCTCVDGVGCQEPCFNKTCSDGEVCAKLGANAGTCVTDTCFLAGCPGCDQVCNAGSCMENPCKFDTCGDGEVCQPNDNFTAFDCVGSCAGVTCDSNQKCQGGSCVTWCDPPCAAGDVCDPSTLTCVTDKCSSVDGCSDGSCCDPVSGDCGNCPCEGVVCPASQECQEGECVSGTGGTGGAAGAGGSAGTGGLGGAGGSGGAIPGQGGSGGTAAQGGGPGQDAGPPEEPDDRVWGLATGGGGCRCRVGTPSSTDHRKMLLLAGALVIAAFARRRSGRKGGAR